MNHAVKVQTDTTGVPQENDGTWKAGSLGREIFVKNLNRRQITILDASL